MKTKEDIVNNVRRIATRMHHGQFRRGPGRVPYIAHPTAVVALLQAWGVNDPDTLAAAWGHDLIEDTLVSLDELLAASNIRVLSYISLLTKDESTPKPLYLEYVASCGIPSVLLIKAADRICNTSDFITAGKPVKARCYLDSASEVLSKAKQLNPTYSNRIDASLTSLFTDSVN